MKSLTDIATELVAARGKTNEKIEGTCSVCLRTIQLRGALPIRHGFSAVNVRHGTTGGWHTGPCGGSNFPHLGISDVGTRWALDKARGRFAYFENAIAALERQPDLTWAPTNRGLPDLTRQITIKPGARPDYSIGSPSYDGLFRERMKELQRQREIVGQAIDNYERVIATYAPSKYPTSASTKVEIVHLAQKRVRTGREPWIGITCKRSPPGWESDRLKKTENPEAVTCKACRKAMGR
jgi:hypothetical protein